MAQRPLERLVGVVERQFQIGAQPRHQILGTEQLPRDRIEPHRELGDPRRLDRESRRRAMPTMLHEQVVAALERVVQVERADRAAAPLPYAVLHRDHHRRPARALDHARGHDADHAGVPLRRIEDDAPGRVEVHRVDPAHRLLEDPAIHRLPRFIELLALARDAVRRRIVLGKQ